MKLTARHIILPVLVIFIMFSGKTQDISDLGLIHLGVEMPEKSNEETDLCFDKIRQKVNKIIIDKGCATYEGSRFKILPHVYIQGTEVVEGGMKNIYKITGTIDLDAIDGKEGTIFGTYSEKFSTVSTNKTQAIKNMVGQMQFKQLREGIDELKRKIEEYYKQNKKVIFSQVASVVHRGEYDEAISLLLDFPSSIHPEYEECLAYADSIYSLKLEEEERIRQNIQRNNNNSLLVKAENYLASGKAEEALYALMDFEVGLEDQDIKYEGIRTSASKMINSEKLREIELEEREYRDNRKAVLHREKLEERRIANQYRLESRRLDALKSIAINHKRKR